MALTFALGSNHDLLINKRGKLQVIYGAEEVKQRILVALQHYWQEYFLNVPAGIPWYEVILGSKDKKTATLIVRRAILDVPGVRSVVALDVRFSATVSRQLLITGSVEVTGISGPQITHIEESLLLGE